MRRTVASFIVILSLCTQAAAQQQAEIDACHQKGSTADIVGCLVQLATVADKHLNAAYQQALKGVDPAGVPALRASERAWLEYRNQRCAALSAGDGTIMRIVASDCTVQMTKDRALELERDSKGLAGPG